LHVDSSQRHAECSVQVPRPRRVPGGAEGRHAAGDHQLPDLVPDLRHAGVRQHGGRVRAQEGPTVPVVAAYGIPCLLRRRQLLIAVALPFLSELGGLLGGISLPVTLAYPCFMWVEIKKPVRGSAMWSINWALGIFVMALSFVLVVGNLWGLVVKGLRVQFFKPGDFQ
jgi:hypothetical protein